MKNKVVDRLTDFIIKNKKCNETQIKIYRYGLEALYNLLTKTVVILIITSILGCLKECLLFILFYTLLRLFAYGLHASNSILCWLTTIPIYVGGSLIIKYLYIPKYIIAIIWSIYTLFVLLWAPADTKKRPLIRKERRRKLKIESLIICFIYYLLIIIVKSPKILNAMSISMILESICICPLTYYITHNRFNNYIYYKKEHGLNWFK